MYSVLAYSSSWSWRGMIAVEATALHLKVFLRSIVTGLCWHVKGKQTVLVFLDCEGMNSWERLEIEDQLLALLSASLSNLTLLKTHFTFDRYVSQMLERFNLGASKVISMCGGSSAPTKVYRGSLMFALKDTQASLLQCLSYHLQSKSLLQGCNIKTHPNPHLNSCRWSMHVGTKGEVKGEFLCVLQERCYETNFWKVHTHEL